MQPTDKPNDLSSINYISNEDEQQQQSSKNSAAAGGTQSKSSVRALWHQTQTNNFDCLKKKNLREKLLPFFLKRIWIKQQRASIFN